MRERGLLDEALPPPPSVMDRFRLHADPVVWSHVSSVMREVEARDAIAFRVGSTGRAWRVAAWLLTIVVGIWRRSNRRFCR